MLPLRRCGLGILIIAQVLTIASCADDALPGEPVAPGSPHGAGGVDPRRITWTRHPLGRFVGSPAVGDFDGNGTPDIAGLSDAQEIHVFSGDGGGHFAEHIAGSLNVSSEPAGFLSARDFDKDGRADLVAEFPAWTIEVFHGANVGTPWYHPATFDDDLGILFGDLDGDGHIDLVALRSIEGFDFSPFTGSGFGNSQFVAYPRDIVHDGKAFTADLNHDGYDDVVAVQGETDIDIAWAGRNGFTRAHHVSDASPRVTVATSADIDGDGYPDLVVEDAAGPIVVGKGVGDGTFVTQARLDVPGCIELDARDINGDGRVDILCFGWDYLQDVQQLLIFWGTPGAPWGFAGPTVVDDQLLWGDRDCLADFNGDGVLDPVVFEAPDGDWKHPDLVVFLSGTSP